MNLQKVNYLAVLLAVAACSGVKAATGDDALDKAMAAANDAIINADTANPGNSDFLFYDISNDTFFTALTAGATVASTAATKLYNGIHLKYARLNLK